MNYDPRDTRDKYIEMTESDMKRLFDGVLEDILAQAPKPVGASPAEAPSGNGRKILW